MGELVGYKALVRGNIRHLAAALGVLVVALLILRKATEVAQPSTPIDSALAIVGATVIPMMVSTGGASRSPTRLPQHTVLIRSGRIIAVAPDDSLAIPVDAIRIDGRGRFVIPGLVDAHVHLLGEASARDFQLYLANGVTTVRNMYGEPYHLRWREAIREGVLVGPTLYTTSPFTDGLATADSARAFVRKAQQVGYDAIKIHLPLEGPVYEALSAEARALEMPLVGHAPGRRLGIAAAVARGQRTIEHAESILQAETDEQRPDIADIRRIVDEMRGSAVCVAPTLSTFRHIIAMTEQYPALSGLLARPEMRHVRADLLRSWQPKNNEYVMRWRGHEGEVTGALAKFRRQYAWMRQLTLALAEAGVPLLAGTDASIAMVVPGYSLHEELDLLVGVGLSPYTALRAATSDAAACLGHRNEFGVVRSGARADLVLLASDPLLNIAAAAHPLGVVVRGHWLSRERLRSDLRPR